MGVSELIDSINATADSPGDLKDEERLALQAACEKLKSKLESPRDAALRILFSPFQPVALRIAVDMKLFDAAVKLSAEKEEVQLDELASEVGADKQFVVRIVRFLIGMDIFQEVGKGVYKPTPLAGAFSSASPLAQGVIHFTSQFEIICNLPSYFAKNGYENPEDAYHGPFQYGRNTDLHSFDWLAARPELQQASNVVMSIARIRGGKHWSESFPVQSKLSVKSPEETLLVDIGGGIGHDLIELKKLHPSLSGTLIVQDIPVVVDSIKDLPSGIQAMKHDFFGPQPVQGAKAYYLANVLHDWPDKQALKILGNVRDAMSDDSMVLINENVLPESGVSLFSAYADMTMMANFSSLERTKKQFQSLLEETGLELVQSWASDDAGSDSGRLLLEAVLKKG